MFFILNIFFFIFHGLWIVFNLFGWMFTPTRRWNLATLLLTGASWFILGIWKGWGYCPCTDWHWDVRRALGLEIETGSYIDFLLIQLFSLDLPRSLVDIGTVSVFFTCLAVSLWVNFRSTRTKSA